MLKWLLFNLAFFAYLNSINACTAFQLKSQDGAILYCRSMEYDFPLDSDLLIVPRGTEFIGTAPDGKEGKEWKVLYGYVGLNQSFAKTVVNDGMNEEGLVIGSLYLPGFTEYEKFVSKRIRETLAPWELGSFLLATCKSVEEVKKILPKTLVVQEPVPDMEGFVVPLHFYVCDRKGKVLIIEYINGKRYEYDNPIGVLTNSPSFDWHLTNLSNFINLSPLDISNLKLENFDVQKLGQGTGLLGLPGDYTPPSRFIRASLFTQWATLQNSAAEAVRLGFHILNTFDIFEGIVRRSLPSKDGIKDSHLSLQKNPIVKERNSEITEWTVVHDMTNLKTYFRGYGSLRIQMVDLTKINFITPGLRQIDVKRAFDVEDESINIHPLSS